MKPKTIKHYPYTLTVDWCWIMTTIIFRLITLANQSLAAVLVLNEGTWNPLIPGQYSTQGFWHLKCKTLVCVCFELHVRRLT